MRITAACAVGRVLVPVGAMYLALACFAALLLLPLGGCGLAATPPPGGYTLPQLRARPEDQLIYPGTETVMRLGREPTTALRQPIAALSGYVLGAQASAEEISAFYDRELRARSWAVITTSELLFGSNESQMKGWRSGALTFRLAVLRKGDPRNPGPEVTDRYVTVFRTELQPVAPP